MDRRSRVLAIAIIVAFIAFLDGAVINIALPAIEAELGGGLTLQQWAVDAYLLTLGSLILLAGSLSDSFGRLRVLRIGLYGFGVTSIVCAIAVDGTVLVVARALQGAAGALLVPSSLALIIANFPSAEQGRAIGRWTAWTTSAFLIGPILGGAFVDLVSWRLVFAINVLPIAVALIMMRPLGRDEPNPDRARVDWLGATLGVVGLGGMVFALIEQGRLGWADPLVFVPALVGVVALVAFVLWERRAPAPMLPLSLFRARNFAAGNLATWFIYAAFMLGLFALPIFLQEVGGFPATLAGLATLPPMVLLVLLGSWFGTLGGKFGPRFFMSAGPVVVGVGYLLTVVVDVPVQYWWQVFPGMVVVGLGMAMTVAPLTSAILGAVDPSRAGIGSAVNNAVARIAGLVSVASIGVIVAGALDVDGYRRTAVVIAALLFVGGLVSWIGIRNPGASDQPSASADAASSEERPRS
ncbi:DHA2 family efflux MFS transporter permease subunit [Agromyces kandeliae]|uniref:DHA2 family efflux MFS transporter permease subunit n=1 Tax=Agromyces kandeliae TaxID=2666141 RepID=A0A6L5R4J8_9MICO|nr:DHA2 family efflux MFS transporter permease subunit [Agromyces kandeliae]MRX44860.1 DHA2 family efflux MFS transporter permease subunit [Agromyces kandeliae]